MKYLIITSHPYEGSFNAAAANAVREAAAKKGHEVRTVDLVKEGFNPVMTEADLAAWRQGKAVDIKVWEYKDAVAEADILVFPFPVWWGAMPAALKGFFDKVFLPGWAYAYNDDGSLKGLLGGKKAIVITTMETPGEVFDTQYQNPVKGAFLKDTLETCGVELLAHFQIDKIISGGRAHGEAKIKDIAQYISKI